MSNGTKDLAENTSLMVISRLAMLAAAPALAVVGWLLVRGINGVDDLGHKVDAVHDSVLETGATVRLVQQQQSAQASILTDHENRMRILERMKPPSVP